MTTSFFGGNRVFAMALASIALVWANDQGVGHGGGLGFFRDTAFAR
jgi:hypothetical protein